MKARKPAERSDASARLVVVTHADAEIFLIGNDRQLAARAVGRLETRQPKGIYKLRVTRGYAFKEELLELDRNITAHTVQVEGLDTVVPFARTLGVENIQKLNDLYATARRGPEMPNLVVVGRMASSERARSPLGNVRLYSWRGKDRARSVLSDAHHSVIGEETWAVAAFSVEPGSYILETRDGVRAGRQAVPVMSRTDRWETRIFVALSHPTTLPSATGQQSKLVDVAVHLSSSNQPLALAPEFETSEVARIALAMGRRIIDSREVIDAFLREKTFDPLAGVAGAHMMLDALERDTTRNEKSASRFPAVELKFSTGDVQQVIGNLSRLLDTPARRSPDVVALKLRAKMPLDGQEVQVDEPPVYYASWEALIGASLGAAPKVQIDLELFGQCASNYAAGAYHAWAPRRGKIGSYVKQIAESNTSLLQSPVSSVSFPAAPTIASAGSPLQASSDSFADRAGIPRAMLNSATVAAHLGRTTKS